MAKRDVVLMQDLEAVIKDSKETVIVIDLEDAKRYIETVRWAQRKMIRAFERTDDLGMRKVINKHGPVLDELIEALGGRAR